MMLLRSATEKDLSSIYHLAMNSGIGMTTLPKDKALLKKRLSWAVNSFNKEVKKPADEYYFFVLEDTDNHKIVGCSAIEAHAGYDLPFYSYKISKKTRICHSLNIRSDYEVLSLVNDNQGKSEMCTLYLDPAARIKHNGQLLSRGRFLFMANFTQRFAPTVIAEMRGISDEKGHSPFWDNVGRHFFHMPFAEADKLTISTNKQFIADLMPRNPIYVKLLTPEAQSVIGKPHQSTAPAMAILLKEGFRFVNYVDIFDAGPTIEAPVAEISTVSRSRLYTIANLSDEVSSDPYLISNDKLDYRCTLAEVLCNADKNTCILGKATAALLQVKQGDTLRISPLN